MPNHSPLSLLLRHARCGVAIALSAILSGCATYNRIADYPEPQKPVAIAVAAKPMSKMSELPVGAYYDEQRQIIVTGHQKGLFTGMLFGVVGVMVADQMNKSSAASKYGSNTSHGTDLVPLTRELVEAAIKDGRSPQWSAAATAAGLRLSPYAVFTVDQSGQARLYAMLRAEIPGPDGSPRWSGRYFARARGMHPLEGSDTWMTDSRFADGIRDALERALRVCIDDTHGRLTGASMQTAKGQFAFINSDWELPMIVVQETPEYVVGRLAAGDAMVMAGTHVLDRADYTFKPGTFKDPRK